MNDAEPGSLVKKVTIDLDPVNAFDLFTTRMAVWWPLSTHSVGLEHATDVQVGTGIGGDIVETRTDGSTSIWGTIDVWEPPERIRFTWHPGTPADEATLVEVRFEASDTGTTLVLTHSGWDRRPDGDGARAQYDNGWEFVLGLYANAGDGAPRDT